MKRIVLFIVAFILWLLLVGKVSGPEMAAGAIVSLLIAYFFGETFLEEPRKCLQLTRYLWFLYYLPVFLWECLKANLDVAYRVLHPLMPIKPGIVKVKTILKTDIAKTMLANSITMTPGTLSIDIKDEYLYVHWINVRTQELEEATKFIVSRFEKILQKVFE